MRLLALDAGLPISTAYRYLHEGITVLAEQAPNLHTVLDQARRDGHTHLTLDGTLVEPDRVAAKTPGTSNDLWYSGKHKKQGGNVQVLFDLTGFPLWSSPVEPGSTHDITVARTHALPALYPAAAHPDHPPSPTRATKAQASASTPRPKANTSTPTPPAETPFSPPCE